MNSNSQNRNKVTLSLLIVLMCVMMLTAASYAWMKMSSTPTVSNLALSVCTQNALEIAPNENGIPGKWGTILDLAEWSKLFGALRPITYVAGKDAFFAPSYGLDGRIKDLDKKITDENGALLPDFSAADEKQKEEGYLYAVDFWIRCETSDCNVSLTTPSEREQGILGNGTFLVGEPVWNTASFKHDGQGNGTENAVRLGLRVYSDGIKDEVTGVPANTGEKAFIIYEPNADGGAGLAETKGIEGGKLEGQNKLIQQKKSTWKDKTPPLKDEVEYETGDFITEDTTVFHLKANCPRHILLYFWLEGQDADCVNSNFLKGGKLLANLQFHGDANLNKGTAHSIRVKDEDIKK